MGVVADVEKMGYRMPPSLWIENHIVLGIADVNTLKEHGWQHTVFILPWDIVSHTHRRHE